jgi:hypothetical protein
MRTTFALLAIAVIAIVALSACRARDDGETDSAAADTAAPSDTADAVHTDTTIGAAASVRPARQDTPRVVQRSLRRASDSSADTTLPPDDSLRRMRPDMPQITPEKRPRTWRGFKLPEEMPVRMPVETIRQVEQVPDSVTKGDSTKPPPPAR